MNNRLIKFRVWDKLAERFITPESLFQGHYSLGLNGRFHNFQNGSGGEEYEVMEFAGLKDSKNIDIYEGDILHFVENKNAFSLSMGLDSPVDQFVDKYTEVTYFKGSFIINPPRCSALMGNQFLLNDVTQYCDVVGNVFENKDLLK